MPRRHASAAVVAVLVLLSAGCGSSDDSAGVGTKGRPKLPSVAASSGIATDEAASAAVARDGGPEPMLYPQREVKYRLKPGVEAPATAAKAYRLVPATVDSDRVQRLARAFGIKGAVSGSPGESLAVQEGGSQLVVDFGGVVSWNYVRDMHGSVSSDVAVACAADAPCPEPPVPPPVTGLPSASEATSKAKSLLEDAGFDVSQLKAVGEDKTTTARTATLAPELDGTEVQGVAHTVTFGENGRVEYANGFFGRFEEVGDYPLVSMDVALERLQSGFGGGGGPRALATDAAESGAATSSGSGGAATSSGSSGSGSAGVAPDEPPPPDGVSVQTVPQSSVAPEVVEITAARVVLQVVYPMCPGQPVYVVPAFAFQPDSAGIVVAVTDGSLANDPATAKTAEPCPGTKPEPAPAPEPNQVPGAEPQSVPPQPADPGPVRDAKP